MKEKTSPTRFIKQLAMGWLLINLLIVVLVGISIRESRLQYEKSATVTTQNLSQILEEYIHGVIRNTDVALLTVADEAEKELALGGINRRLINTYLSRQKARTQELDTVRLSDEKGFVLYGTGVVPNAHINIADRDYFLSLSNNPKGSIFISKPVMGRISGKWVMIVARRINHSNGSFAGVVYAGIVLENFAGTFSKINTGKNGIVVLIDDKGSVICRYPEPHGIGSTVGGKVKSTEVRELLERGAVAGTFRTRSTFDGVERTHSCRKISSYPLYVVVGLAQKNYLSEWRSETKKILALLSLFFIVTLCLAWMIYRYFLHRIEAEETLQKSERKYRSLIETTDTGFVILDKEGLVLDANSEYVRLTGHQRLEDIFGRSVMEWTTGHDFARNAAEVKKCFEEGSVRNLNIDYIDKDGKITPIEINATVVDTGKSLLVVTLCRDITERKKAELSMRNALAEAQRFRNALDHAPSFVYMKDLQSRYIYANRPTLELFGCSADQLIGSDDSRFFPTDTVKHLREIDRRVFLGEDTTEEIDVNYKDGDRRVYLEVKTPMYEQTDNRTICGLLGISTDITGRKKDEELIGRSLKEKEALLREIHHRVKNNMAVVSSLLSLQANKIEDPTVKSLFEVSQQRVKSMALVHEKLYHTKDLSSINFEDYIKSIVSEIISLYRVDTTTITTEINIEGVELDLESAVPCGLIINELLTNAFKHAFPDNRSGALSVHFTKTDDTYTLAIKDNGIGLPERFAHKETRTLGLRLVNVLTNQLNGTLQIKSDKGTEAVVTFKTERN